MWGCVVLVGLGDLQLEQTLKFKFKATNNQARYEVILAALNLAYDMGFMTFYDKCTALSEVIICP